MAVDKKVPTIRFKGFEEEWEEKKLGELGAILTGSTPSTQNESYYSDSGILWVTPTDITENIIYTSAKKLSIEGQKIARIVPGDSILVTCIASIGKNALLGKEGSFNQQINAIVVDKIVNDSYFLFTHSFNWSLTMKKIAASGTMQIVNKKEFSELSTILPQLPEQTQIGNYFKSLDELIALQEQKLEKVKNLKKAMLEKMFPAAGADVPEIRFKGFTGRWEKKKLGEIFDFNIPTNSFSRSLLNDNYGGIKNIHYGDILIRYNNHVNVQKDEIPYITNGNINDFKSHLLKNGDVIFADAAEDNTVGKCIEILNVEENYIVSGLHTIVARPLTKFQNYYLGYYFNSNSFHNQLLPLMQGTKVLSISKTNLKITYIKFPKNEKEQHKIGQYFHNLDRLIQQSQQKIEQLKHLKQAMLQKMFI